MKLVFAIALFSIVSCNNAVKKEAPQMPGAYNMLSQSMNDGKKDTTYTTAKQLKIYTEDHMMYANINPADSIASFGIATYSADTGTVIEKIIYSASDTSVYANPDSFTLLIEKTPKGYKQVIPDIESRGQHFKLTEDYETVGTATKSPLDGAWKEVKSIYIKGKDTTTNSITQFKTYYAGHFIWGHTYLDSTNKSHTGIGFGSFELSGTTKLKETVTASTYYQVRGQAVDIDIEMTGTDEFKQTITNTDGSKSMEFYQRIKK